MADRTLSNEEITAELGKLPDWSGDTTGIRRTIDAASFPAAIALVDRVAVVAEQRDHHPDIDIRWRKVTFALVTHSAGGVTAKDLELASEIDVLVTR